MESVRSSVGGIGTAFQQALALQSVNDGNEMTCANLKRWSERPLASSRFGGNHP